MSPSEEAAKIPVISVDASAVGAFEIFHPNDWEHPSKGLVLACSTKLSIRQFATERIAHLCSRSRIANPLDRSPFEVLVFRWARRFSSAIAVASFLACSGSNGSTADTSPPQALAGKIAFMRDGKIWIIDERMNVRRLAPWHRLAAEPGFDRPLTWSPDGSKLLFWNHSRGRWDIWVMDANGTNRKNLTRTRTGGSRSPSWSPDGSRIAFMRDNPRGLYLMSADGKSQERLSTKGHRDAVPAWSPDGRRIAYTDARLVGDHVALDIFVVDLDGQHEMRLVEYGSDPAWSRDGEHLLFVGYRRGSSDLFLIAPDGKNEVNLTNSPEREWSPVRSPDGSRIAYLATSDGKTELRLMDANGTNAQRLTDFEETRWVELSWSPDGSWLAFVSGAEGNEAVYIIGINGQNLRKLVDGGARFPVWQPPG